MFTSLKRFLLSVSIAIPWRKPLAVQIILFSYLKAKLTRKPVLRGVDIVVNLDCNLRCAHCNVEALSQDKACELNLDDCRKIEKECTELGVFQYTFTGGEPLLREDFDEIVKTFKPYKRLMLLQTNAILIDSMEKARWLKNIGIDIVNISLDSGIAEEHDINRASVGSYLQAINALNLCRKAGLRVIIGTVVTHNNLYSQGLHDLFQFARREKISVILNLAVPAGRWLNNTDILLTEKDQLYVRQLLSKNPYLRLDMNSAIHRYGCPAFKEKLYISPSLDVMGCTFVQISFGNLKDQSLKEIREKALATDFMNKYARRCYAAENREFINRYLTQLGSGIPKTFEEISSKAK